MLAFLLYFLIGALAGLFTGLLGIGGGVIVVPALAWVFEWEHLPSEITMQMAAASSLAAMLVSTAMAAWAHQRRGIQIWPIYKQLIIGTALGTIGGVVLAYFLKGHLLHKLFGFMVIWVAITLFFEFNKNQERAWPGLWGRSFISLFIGFCAGLFGIGGGAVTIPALHYFNVPLRNIIGISSAVSFSVALIGTFAYIVVGLYQVNLPPHSLGYVYWPAVLGIIIASPLFAYWGVILSHRLPVILLRKIFAVFLVVIGLDMIFS